MVLCQEDDWDELRRLVSSASVKEEPGQGASASTEETFALVELDDFTDCVFLCSKWHQSEVPGWPALGVANQRLAKWFGESTDL
jgi:hypothetical protein